MSFEFKKVVVTIIGKIAHYHIFKLFHNITIDYMYIKLVLKNTPTILYHKSTYLSRVSCHTSLSVRLGSKICKKQLCLMMRHLYFIFF